MDVKARNKEVKRILSKEFGAKNVSVVGGKGTAYGWCTIEISVPDPCPVKANDMCGNICKNGICQGNNNMIVGGWGRTVKQLLYKKINDKVLTLIKDIEFYHYYDDFNSKISEVNTKVRFV